MSTMTNGLDRAGSQAATPPDARAPRRGLPFWIVRYLPAEVVGTVAMIMAGILITLWTDNPALIALAALVAADVVFYAIAAGAFTLTARAGLRDAHLRRERAS